MARWRLTAAHYLMTDPPAEVEFKETDRNTGRQARKVYPIPRYLHPDDPGDYNYPGEVVVCDGKNPQPKDIIFLGEPTGDMSPIDDEAKRITAEFIAAGRWKMPEEGLNQGDMLIKAMMDKMDKIQFQPISGAGVDPKAFADMQVQVKALIEQNVKLQAQLVAKPTLVK